MKKKIKNINIIAAIFILFGGIYGQNKFEGYSLVVEADSGGACPVRYLPSAGNGNAIEVFVAGTGQQMPAANLKPCDGSRAAERGLLFPNGDGRWCFEASEPFYDVKLRNGTTYLWPATTNETGFYNVKDFRPVTRTGGATPQYVFSEPADYTKTIKNAVAVIAARQGGTLRFPDGDYTVGTLDGNRRDPSFEAITLPSGIVIEGSGWNFSIPTTNLPSKTSSTRIRIRNENQTIFRIGGCTNHVTVRQLELLGNTAFFGEAKRESRGTYGIEGLGKWAINPASGVQTQNTTQGIRIENITFQDFDKGIFVHNANDENCNAREQYCGAWQFDYVIVDHAMFINNKTGLWIDSFDTDWNISNSFFAYAIANAPGDGIRIKKAGGVQIASSYGGGYNYGTGIGGKFINLGASVSVTVIACAAENGQYSIYTDPKASSTSSMLTVIGSVFGNEIDLNGRQNYISTGNFYGARTIQADPAVTITSIGDRYCYDSQNFGGRCIDEAGRAVQRPGITGGRKMFETGQMGEDTGPGRLEARPNYFGYNVRIGDGLMQFDPRISFKDITSWAAGAGTRPPVEDGAFLYCKDCRKGSNGICTQGNAGSDGAFAKRINGQWRCD